MYTDLLKDAIFENNIDKVNELTCNDNYIDINKIYENDTLLTIACKLNNNMIIKSIIWYPGININILNGRALWILIFRQNYHILNLIINEIDVNIMDEYYGSILHYLVKYTNNIPLIKLVVQVKNFNVNIMYNNNTPLTFLQNQVNCLTNNELLATYNNKTLNDYYIMINIILERNDVNYDNLVKMLNDNYPEYIHVKINKILYNICSEICASNILLSDDYLEIKYM